MLIVRALIPIHHSLSRPGVQVKHNRANCAIAQADRLCQQVWHILYNVSVKRYSEIRSLFSVKQNKPLLFRRYSYHIFWDYYVYYWFREVDSLVLNVVFWPRKVIWHFSDPIVQISSFAAPVSRTVVFKGVELIIVSCVVCQSILSNSTVEAAKSRKSEARNIRVFKRSRRLLSRIHL